MISVGVSGDNEGRGNRRGKKGEKKEGRRTEDEKRERVKRRDGFFIY